jgi:GAF domain-containing protein
VFDFKITAADKPALYRDLLAALESMVAGEPDPIANMANASALIWETLPDLNWAGFYRNVDGELVVGPFRAAPPASASRSARASAASRLRRARCSA